MLMRGRRKRARRQTDFFNPELQQGLTRTEKKGNNRPPSNPNSRSVGSPPTISRRISSSEPGGRTSSSYSGDDAPRKKQYIESKDSGAQASDSTESDGESDGGDKQMSPIGSTQNMLVEGTQNGKGSNEGRGLSRRRHKRHHTGSISQTLGEDIICDAGIAFLPPSFDSDDDIDHDTMLHKYADRPGVTRYQPSAKKPRRGSAVNGSSNAQSAGRGADKVRYRSRITYEGASINLGNHISSAAAVAMQDLANLSLLGSDHSKTMHILSKDEAWVGLRAAKLPTALPSYGRVDAFRSLFTEQYKPVFEQQIEDALASIGGQDDFLADALSSLDLESYRQAEMFDAAEEAKRTKAKKQEEKQQAREARRAKKAEKPLKLISLSHNVNSPIFRGEHGVYGVDDGGRYFWFRGRVKKTRKDESEQAMQQTPHEGEAGNRKRSAVETDSDIPPNSADSCESSEKPQYASMPADIEVPSVGSSTPSQPLRRRQSPTLSEQRRSRVRILSFDSCSTCSSVDIATDTKERPVKAVENAESTWTLRDVFSPDDVKESVGTARQRSTHASGPQKVSFRSSISVFEPNAENVESVPAREPKGGSKKMPSSEARGVPEAITITSTTNQGGASRAEAFPGQLPPSLVSFESIGSEQAIGALLSPAKEKLAQNAVDHEEEPVRCSAKKNAGDKPFQSEDDMQSFRPLLSEIGEQDIICRNERLKPALEILQNFTITPLLSSEAPGGERVDGSDATGKVLTGLKFKSKVIGRPHESRPVNLSDQEFVIDVGIGEDNVPVLKLRAPEPIVVSETLRVTDNLAARVASTVSDGKSQSCFTSSQRRT